MNLTPKKRLKLQKKLGELRAAHGAPRCWVCGSPHGTKTAREGYGTRCTRCIKEGRTTPDVVLYEKIRDELAGVADPA